MDSVKKGQLRGNFSKVADIRIIDENPLYEYRDITTGSEKFIFLDRTLHGKQMRVQVDTTEQGIGKESFELIGDADKIAANYLSEGSAQRSLIEWDFDYNHRKITDGELVVFAEPDKFDDGSSPGVQSGYNFPQVIATANAQTVKSNVVDSDAKQSEAPKVSPKADSTAITKYVEQLLSDDPTVRRNGRDFLVATGSEAIPLLMSALRASKSDYRLKVGAAYVLSTALIRDPEQKTEISAKLSDDDFPVLVSLASDEDKTIRYQATEFLYDLGDPRSIPYSVDAARSTPDPNRASNQILILGKSSQDLSISDRNNIVNDLTHGPGMNNDVVGNEGFVKKWLGVNR
jgi:hypothetical protein